MIQTADALLMTDWAPGFSVVHTVHTQTNVIITEAHGMR